MLIYMVLLTTKISISTAPYVMPSHVVIRGDASDRIE